MENYPTVSLILRHGKPLAIVLSALIPLGAIVLAIEGWSLLVLPVGVVLGIVAFGLLMSYVEIVRIIADTLLPR